VHSICDRTSRKTAASVLRKRLLDQCYVTKEKKRLNRRVTGGMHGMYVQLNVRSEFPYKSWSRTSETFVGTMQHSLLCGRASAPYRCVEFLLLESKTEEVSARRMEIVTKELKKKKHWKKVVFK
jgi:hypothetical protein